MSFVSWEKIVSPYGTWPDIFAHEKKTWEPGGWKACSAWFWWGWVDGRDFSMFLHSAQTWTSPFSQPKDPELNARDVVLPSQIFMWLCPAASQGLLAWSHLQKPGDTGHSDTGNSLQWFSGTLDNFPKTLFSPTPGMEPRVDGALLVSAQLRTGRGSGGQLEGSEGGWQPSVPSVSCWTSSAGPYCLSLEATS